MEIFQTLIGILKDPINIILAMMCLLLAVALVWMSQCFSYEREQSKKYAEELMKNTLVLQELSHMVNRLVLGRGE